MSWASLFEVTEWPRYWQMIAGGTTMLSALAAVPRIGPPVRGALLGVLRAMPPLAELRVQAAEERCNIERDRALRYRAELDELTAELKRRGTDIDRLTEEVIGLVAENALLLASLDSSDGSSASPSAPPARSRATRSSSRHGSRAAGSRRSAGRSPP